MKRITCVIALVLLPACFASGRDTFGTDLQEEPLYVTYLAGAVEVDRTPDNQVSDFEEADLGMAIPAGTVVRTGAGALCEVTAPDGSVIKIAEASVFRLERMLYSQATEEKRGRFELIFGKLWSKVERLVSDRSSFQVVSGTTLAGIRGTSLGVGYDGTEAEVLVFEGSVELASTTGAFEPVTLRAGQTSVVRADASLEPVRRITRPQVEAWERAVDVRLPEPRRMTRQAGPEEEAEETGGEPEEQPRDRKFFLEAVLGSLSLGDQVYARAALLPTFNLGRLAGTLYFPVIFSPHRGLFDANSWQNRDQWDFRDLEDGIHDALIKVRSLRWGEPGDPVYLAMGELPQATLGHGFIVDRFSNAIGLPLEPRTGLLAAVDAGGLRVDALVSDASRFQLLAGRLGAGPFGDLPLIFGLSAMHDRPQPASAARPLGPSNPTENQDQLPRIWILGADLELPLRDTEGFQAAAYVDAAKIGYTFPELHPDLQGTGYAGAGSLEFLKGMGVGAGVAGTSRRFSFRLEYRLAFDYYEPGLIGTFWENRRLQYQQELLDLILAQSSDGFEHSVSSGVLLAGGFPLVKGMSLDLGYHNYQRSDGVEEHRVQGGFTRLSCTPGPQGRFTASLALHRRDNLESLRRDFFDHDTILEASAAYAITPAATLALEARRASLFDDESGAWTPLESIGVSTSLRF